MSPLEAVPAINPSDPFGDGDTYGTDTTGPAPAGQDEELPAMVAEGGKPTDQEALEAALATGPVMAGDWWDMEFVPVVPAFFPIQGSDLPLIYRGKSHSVNGEPGLGKSMVIQYLHLLEAFAGRTSLFIDFEKSFGDFRERLRTLGATKEQAALIGYWSPPGSITHASLAKIAAFTKQWGVEVITIDAWGRALSRAGMAENDNDDVRAWYDHVVDPMVRAGRTPIIIDHVPKPSNDHRGGAPGAPRFSKGAAAKLEVITGAAYAVSFVTPFSRSKAGLAKLIVAKDNKGARHIGQVAAEIHVTPSQEGAVIDMTLKAPAENTNPDGQFRPTGYMEKVSRLLEDVSEALSISKIKKELGGKGEWVGVAVERLIDEGFVSSTPGPRNAKLIASVKAFRADDESSDDSTGNPF